MAYQAWSVVFGEQPSASKWNILGTNDASFNDGSGIADDAILARHILAGAVGGTELSTSALLLGSASRTSNTSTASTSFVDTASLTSTVTVPAGGRSVLVLLEADRWACSTTGVGIYAEIQCDGVTIGTFTLTAHNTANGALPLSFFALNTPASGSRTYKMRYKTDGGTLTITASATSPARLVVIAL